MSKTQPRSELSLRTLKSQNYQLLRERPRTPDEIPNALSATSPLRELVAKLKAPRNSGGSTRSRGRTQPVYYLWGDDRRAIRRFIEANTEYVQSCMEDDPNPLSIQWDDALWSLLKEEWDYYHRVQGGDSDA